MTSSSLSHSAWWKMLPGKGVSPTYGTDSPELEADTEHMPVGTKQERLSLTYPMTYLQIFCFCCFSLLWVQEVLVTRRNPSTLGIWAQFPLKWKLRSWLFQTPPDSGWISSAGCGDRVAVMVGVAVTSRGSRVLLIWWVKKGEWINSSHGCESCYQHVQQQIINSDPSEMRAAPS